ncbi:hypothetical protein M1N68_02020 [Peptococcaceae bacterium]|nr:hypothetical protein [Peptococcaceae bacterium]
MGINVLPVSITTPAGVNILNVVPQHVTVVIDELIKRFKSGSFFAWNA